MNAIERHLFKYGAHQPLVLNGRHHGRRARRKPGSNPTISGPCVYVLEVNGLPGWLKVGCTTRLSHRLSSYRTHTPMGVKLLHRINCETQKDAQQLEKRIHAELIECHLKGKGGGDEWFKDTLTTRGILAKHGMK